MAKKPKLTASGSSNVALLLDLLKNESPRCIPIVVTAYFDETLAALLGDKKDRSFTSRVHDARNHGLLTNHEADDLLQIKEIRNRFAHDLKKRRMDASDREAIHSLRLWTTVSRRMRGYRRLFGSAHARLTYVAIVIAFRLEARKTGAIASGPPPEPKITDIQAWPPVVGR